jgi:molybdopterin converting factor subunit 1
MKISISFFAQSREIAGTNQMDMEIPDGEDVSGLVRKLQLQYPGFSDLQILLAVNTEYVENNYRLHDGDRVAIIPPISGG